MRGRWLHAAEVGAGTLALVLLVSGTARGHVLGGEAEGFWQGAAHPVSGLDHVLAMVAVGLWGAQLGAPALWLLPVTFPLLMSLGAVMGLAGLPVPGVEAGIALSAIALGTMICLQVRPALWVAASIVAGFAIFHGHAHGTELPAGASGLHYSFGFVTATGCLHALGIVLGLMQTRPGGRILIRGAGGVVAAAGLAFLWRALGPG